MTGVWFGQSASDQQTRIRKLSIRAPEAMQQQLQRDISLADWPEVNDQRVVFIRRIHATAPAHQIASELKDQARSLISYGNSDNVRIFDNSVEMLAALLSDAALGQIATKWYWKKWHSLSNHTPASAITQIAGDFSDSVTGAINTLVHKNKASALFTALNESEASYLLAMLCHELGYPTPSSSVATDNKPADHPVSNALNTASAITLPDNILQRWRSVFHSFPENSTSITPHIQLAAWIIAKQYLPLMLIQAPDTAIAIVTQKLRAVTDSIHSNSVSRKQQSNFSDGNTGKHEQSSALPDQDKLPVASIKTNNADKSTTHLPAGKLAEMLREANAPISSASSESDSDSINWDNASIEPTSTRSHTITDNVSEMSEPIFAQAETVTPVNWAFNTEQGGILFLLNFLSREPAQAIVRDYWAQLPNGWLWLLGLATELSVTVSDDPLCGFIRAQAGLEDALYLPLPDDGQLSALARKLYGAEVWNSELLALPASVQATPDHVSLMADISRTDISLRLAGLDLDPGWMPWLGQVVRFYFEPGYDSSRHLR